MGSFVTWHSWLLGQLIQQKIEEVPLGKRSLFEKLSWLRWCPYCMIGNLLLGSASIGSEKIPWVWALLTMYWRRSAARTKSKGESGFPCLTPLSQLIPCTSSYFSCIKQKWCPSWNQHGHWTPMLHGCSASIAIRIWRCQNSRPCLVSNKSPTYKSGDLKPVTYKSGVFGC